MTITPAKHPAIASKRLYLATQTFPHAYYAIIGETHAQALANIIRAITRD